MLPLDAPLDDNLPVGEIITIVAPVADYPSEMTCIECRRLMMPMSWPDGSRWRCFLCDRLVVVELPDVDPEL